MEPRLQLICPIELRLEAAAAHGLEAEEYESSTRSKNPVRVRYVNLRTSRGNKLTLPPFLHAELFLPNVRATCLPDCLLICSHLRSTITTKTTFEKGRKEMDKYEIQGNMNTDPALYPRNQQRSENKDKERRRKTEAIGIP